MEALVRGEPADAQALLALAYDELRELAAAYLSRERADHTLQPTALVHEAWMRLIDQSRVDWQGRAHFVGIAAQAMRRILVDHARGRAREKRGGDRRRVELETGLDGGDDAPLDVIDLDRALGDLARLSERQARIVELRFFGGLDTGAIAESLGVSGRTVEREWRFAQAWLAEALERPGS